VIGKRGNETRRAHLWPTHQLSNGCFRGELVTEDGRSNRLRRRSTSLWRLYDKGEMKRSQNQKEPSSTRIKKFRTSEPSAYSRLLRVLPGAWTVGGCSRSFAVRQSQRSQAGNPDTHKTLPTISSIDCRIVLTRVMYDFTSSSNLDRCLSLSWSCIITSRVPLSAVLSLELSLEF
jgi:hypothetical protein